MTWFLSLCEPLNAAFLENLSISIHNTHWILDMLWIGDSHGQSWCVIWMCKYLQINWIDLLKEISGTNHLKTPWLPRFKSFRNALPQSVAEYFLKSYLTWCILCQRTFFCNSTEPIFTVIAKSYHLWPNQLINGSHGPGKNTIRDFESRIVLLSGFKLSVSVMSYLHVIIKNRRIDFY